MPAGSLSRRRAPLPRAAGAATRPILPSLATPGRPSPALAPAPDAVPSPCISICRIDAASGLCEGCSRTLDEIAAWAAMDDAARRAVWRELPARGGPCLDVPDP